MAIIQFTESISTQTFIVSFYIYYWYLKNKTGTKRIWVTWVEHLIFNIDFKWIFIAFKYLINKRDFNIYFVLKCVFINVEYYILLKRKFWRRTVKVLIAHNRLNVLRTVCNVLIITQGKIQTQITYNTSHKFCCSFVFPQSLLGLALYFKYNGKLIAVDTCSSSTQYITNYCFAISHMVVFVLIFLKFLRVWCPLHWNMHWISSLFYFPIISDILAYT